MACSEPRPRRVQRSALYGSREIADNSWMVARLWHGYCSSPEHADAYEAMLKPELLPGVSKKQGYRGSHLLRRELGGEIEFITILFFDSLEDIKAIAGADYETAVIPPQRRRHLSRFDAKASHFEVPASHAMAFASPR